MIDYLLLRVKYRPSLHFRCLPEFLLPLALFEIVSSGEEITWLDLLSVGIGVKTLYYITRYYLVVAAVMFDLVNQEEGGAYLGNTVIKLLYSSLKLGVVI